jgi:hypothetical protein
MQEQNETRSDAQMSLAHLGKQGYDKPHQKQRQAKGYVFPK